MALDLTKPLRHEDSHEPAFIVALPSGQYVTIIDGCNDTGTRVYHAKDREEAERMLENVPERRTLDCWLNIYDDGFGAYAARTREQANGVSVGKRIACVHITQEYEVGEGL